MDWPDKICLSLLDKIKRIKFGRDFFIFLFFLGLSTLFWLLNQLSKDTTASVSFPVRFSNTVPNRIIVNKLPSHLFLKVKGRGYALLKYKIKPKTVPLAVNIRSFPLRPAVSGNAGRYYLLSSYIRGSVNNQLRQHLELVGIKPDTLYFVFDSLVNRKLPVYPNINLVLSRQFILKEPVRISPDTVVASGPAGILDTMKNIPTVFGEYRDIKESFNKTLPLKKMNKISLSVKKVQVSVKVEQFTESVFLIPLKQVNVPDTIMLRTFPSSVKVTFHVGLSRYKKILPDLFTAQVDYRDILHDHSGKLKIYLVRQPDNIKSVRIDPDSVEYIIEKKP